MVYQHLSHVENLTYKSFDKVGPAECKKLIEHGQLEEYMEEFVISLGSSNGSSDENGSDSQGLHDLANFGKYLISTLVYQCHENTLSNMNQAKIYEIILILGSLPNTRTETTALKGSPYILSLSCAQMSLAYSYTSLGWCLTYHMLCAHAQLINASL